MAGWGAAASPLQIASSEPCVGFVKSINVVGPFLDSRCVVAIPLFPVEVARIPHASALLVQQEPDADQAETSMTCVVDKEETRTRREPATPASRLSSTDPTPRPLVAF